MCMMTTSKPNTAAWCLDCSNELRGVERKCPECGRGFSPQDPTSFAAAKPPRFRPRQWFLAGSVLFLFGMAGGLLAFPIGGILWAIGVFPGLAMMIVAAVRAHEKWSERIAMILLVLLGAGAALVAYAFLGLLSLKPGEL